MILVRSRIFDTWFALGFTISQSIHPHIKMVIIETVTESINRSTIHPSKESGRTGGQPNRSMDGQDILGRSLGGQTTSQHLSLQYVIFFVPIGLWIFFLDRALTIKDMCFHIMLIHFCLSLKIEIANGAAG